MADGARAGGLGGMPRQLATPAAPVGLPGMAQPPSISSPGDDLQRRLDRLTDSQAGFAARVRRLDDVGPVVPQTLRDALAEFSRELDELRADLDGLCEDVVAPLPGLTR